MVTTDNPRDPRLTRGVDETRRDQAEAYLVLSDAERARGFIRPIRARYRHIACGTTTTMGHTSTVDYTAPWERPVSSSGRTAPRWEPDTRSM